MKFGVTILCKMKEIYLQYHEYGLWIILIECVKWDAI